MNQNNKELKTKLQKFWDSEVCGTRYGSSASLKQYFDEIEQARYTLEPYILDFAGFTQAKNKKVLEIGVGGGVDFCNWIKNGAIATGIDLTNAAISLTHERLRINNIDSSKYKLYNADAENLPFRDNEFDIVYSYGVLQHTPDTTRAFQEAFRVLKPGGDFRAMVYHVPSWTGWMLWFFHCFLKGKPFQSVKEAIANHLQGPRVKAYTLPEIKKLLIQIGFNDITLRTKLNPGDTLMIKPGREYQAPIFRIIWKLYPRWLVRRIGDRYGFCLLIKASK